MIRAVVFLLCASLAKCCMMHHHSNSFLRLRGGASNVVAPSNAIDKFSLADGREVFVFADAKGIDAGVVESVKSLAKACIAKKGAFSMAIPGGSVVKALSCLDPSDLDFSKVHVFFCNERIGEWKCYKGALDSFVNKCKIPLDQVHKVPNGTPEEVAEAYSKLLAAQSENVCGKKDGLPSLDLVLLGTGADGHCASIYPSSKEVEATGSGSVALPIKEGGKTSITLSIDTLSAASYAILSAAKGERAGMVVSAFASGTNMATKYSCPSGMVMAANTLWFCDSESIAQYTR